jgi:hypothetical protein
MTRRSGHFSKTETRQMSQYSNLPIYNTTVSCLKDFYQRVPKFSKQYKYLLGGKLIEYNIKIISLIFVISNSKDKEKRVSLVDEIIKNINLLIIHTRICNELKQFGKDSSYLYISENLVDICNQAEKWKKYLAE